ncbi:putative endonuclease [Sinorhizobium phage phiM6]|nr:putative endonuclease [Sinorhizobium phage phiM6]
MPKIGKRIVKNPSEHKCYQHLQTIVPEGFKVEYETETLPYVIEHEYRPDYPITKGDGSKLYIEYKGNGRAFDNAVRQKMIAVKKKYPGVDFCIVFHSDGKIGPKRKDGSFMKQSDWATKNGFKFCIGMQNIPKDWFE